MTPITLNDKTKPIWPLDPKLLLHPNIPGNAAGLNPRSIMGQEWWDSTRRSAEELNNHCCYACGIHKSDTDEGWLEGHEGYEFDYENRVTKYIRTVSLCRSCHSYIHSGLLINRLSSKEIDPADYVKIILRGVMLLRNAEPPQQPAPHQVMHMTLAIPILPPPDSTKIASLLASFPDELRTRAMLAVAATDSKTGSWTLRMGAEVFTYRDLLGPT